MKNVTKIYIPFILGLFLMLSACSLDSTSTNNDNGGDNSATNKLVKEAKELVEPSYEDCSGKCPVTVVDGNYEISADCARCMASNFKLNGYNFPKTDDGENIRGFKIEQEELTEILENIGEGNTANVYTMMGIKNMRGKIESDIYFDVEVSDLEGNIVSRAYYDFTQPCPNFCPHDDGSL